MVASRALALNHTPTVLTDGSVDYLTGTIRAALFDNALVPSFADKFLNDIVAQEIGDTDYARQLVDGKSIAQEPSGEFWTKFDGNDVDFGADVTISARYMYLFHDTGNPATSELLWYVDLNDGGNENVSSTNAAFRVEWSADGIWRIDPDKDRT